MNANEKERWRFSQKRKVFTEYSWKNIFNGNHRGHGIFDSRGGWYLFSESKQPESWRMNLDESDPSVSIWKSESGHVLSLFSGRFLSGGYCQKYGKYGSWRRFCKAGGRFEEELTGISGSLGECKENYRSIRELSSERGYTPHAGNYGKLLEQDEKLREGFAAVADDHSWVDGTWVTKPACGGRSRRDKRGGSNFGIVCADTAESWDICSRWAASYQAGTYDRREQIFETMAETDALVLELKQENINLSQQLTKLTGEVRKNVEDIASVSQQNMIVMIAVVLAVSFLLLVVLTTIISRSMQVSIRGFKHALSEMTPARRRTGKMNFLYLDSS